QAERVEAREPADRLIASRVRLLCGQDREFEERHLRSLVLPVTAPLVGRDLGAGLLDVLTAAPPRRLAAQRTGSRRAHRRTPLLSITRYGPSLGHRASDEDQRRPANRSSSGTSVSTNDLTSSKSSVGHASASTSRGTANQNPFGSICVAWAISA